MGRCIAVAAESRVRRVALLAASRATRSAGSAKKPYHQLNLDAAFQSRKSRRRTGFHDGSARLAEIERLAKLAGQSGSTAGENFSTAATRNVASACDQQAFRCHPAPGFCESQAKSRVRLAERRGALRV